MTQNYMIRFTRRVERLSVLATSRLMGPEFAVRYVRNPIPALTPSVLRQHGATIGRRTTFKRSLFLDNTIESQDCAGDFRNLRLGDNCYIGDLVYFDLAGEIEVGDNAIISGAVSIVTHRDCHRSPDLARLFPRIAAKVTLGAGCWIGYGVTILAGVTIGPRAVVGAGALVTTSLGADAVYTGVPAARRRTLTFDAVQH